jgi:Transcriptional Coactivator p15 (PC4)
MRVSKKRSARAAENDYAPDDGFVVDSDGDGDTPLAKRMKTTVAGRKESADSRQKNKPGKGEAVGSADIDDNGDIFWEVGDVWLAHCAGERTDRVDHHQISHNRRVTISEFKGKQMVSVREYYEKDGKHLPGKKVPGPKQTLRNNHV